MIADEIQAEILNDNFRHRVGSTLLLAKLILVVCTYLKRNYEDKWKLHDLDSSQGQIGDFCS